jgi:hypothetical protein
MMGGTWGSRCRCDVDVDVGFSGRKVGRQLLVMNEMWGAISLSIEIILLVEPLCSPVVSIAYSFRHTLPL